MKCPYCGGEIGDGDRCEFCNSMIPYEMKKELERLNKKGCPVCRSTNISFTREQEGETWDSGSRRYIRRTVGLCNDCGHTWYTDLPYDNSGDFNGGSQEKKTDGGGDGKTPPKSQSKTSLWMIIAALLAFIVLLGNCHGDSGRPSGNWSSEEETVNVEETAEYVQEMKEETIATEEETEYVQELDILTISPIVKKEYEIGKAEIITHSGKIKKADQDNVYSFTPNRSGTYRLELSGIHNNGDMILSIYNSLGERMHYTYASNENGLTVTDLKKDKQYKIHVSHDDGLSPYTLSIAQQKKRENITDYSLIKDSIEFTDQDNIYTYVAPIDGTYRFEFSEIHDNKDMMLSIFNDLGERLRYTYAGNNNGITIKLNRGDKYTIHVTEEDGYSPYYLKIGRQKDYVDISQFDGVQDNIEYTDQENVYMYTVSNSGEYEFSFYEMKAGIEVCISIYNRLGERLRYRYCGNEDSLSVNDLEEGETYEIHVKYEDGVSPYTMFVQ